MQNRIAPYQFLKTCKMFQFHCYTSMLLEKMFHTARGTRCEQQASSRGPDMALYGLFCEVLFHVEGSDSMLPIVGMAGTV